MSEQMKSPACREQAGPSDDLSTGAEQAVTTYTDGSQKATGWLRALASSGFINIVTANVEKFGATVKTRTFIDDEAMQAYIEAEHDMGRDVYWQPNECDDREYRKEITLEDGTTKMVNTRPGKDDVTAIRVLHLDVDFKGYFGANRGYTPADVDELFARLQRGQALGPKGEDVPPTAIVASGGGFHAYWVLAAPLPKTDATTARVESINANIAKLYRADAGTLDISRLLRVAHTTNFKPGRNRAKVLDCVLNDNRYTLDDFAEARDLPLDKPKKTADLANVGEPLPVADLSKLGLRISEDHDTIALIVWSPPHHDPSSRWGEHQGRGFEQPPELYDDERQYLFGEDQRSERVISVVSRLANRKVPVEMICGVLLNPAFGVSAHVLDQTSPALYAKHQCRHIEQPVISGDFISLAPIPDNLPPPPILVPNWLMDRRVTTMAGRGGVGKSFIALNLAVAIALGREHFGFKPKERRKVLILETEDGLEMLQFRLWAICKEYDIDQRELEGWIITKPLLSLELIVKKETEDGVEFVKTPQYEAILAGVEKHDVGVIIVDPFAESYANVNEIDNTDMKSVVVAHRVALAMMEKPVSLLICHHTRKGYTQEGAEQDAIRGAGAIVNASRYCHVVEPLTSDEKEKMVSNAAERRFIKVIDAKRNYEEQLSPPIYEFKGHVHPSSGFNVGVLVRPDLTVIDEHTPAELWPHVEAVKAEVRRRYGTRPFSNASTGKTEHRFDAWLRKKFELSKDDAKLIIGKLFREKVLATAEWKDEKRELKTVVVVHGEVVPDTMLEIPF